MKKIITALFILFLSVGVKAQMYYSTSNSPSVANFLAEAGDYITQDTYEIDKSKLNLKVVILTDFSSGKKIGYVDYTSQDATGNAFKTLASINTHIDLTTYYTSYLDYDEIQKCIDILEYAREYRLTFKPNDHNTRFYYTSKLGGKIGVKCEGVGTWYVFVNADPMGDPAFERVVEGKGMEKVIDAFKTAKELINKLTEECE